MLATLRPCSRSLFGIWNYAWRSAWRRQCAAEIALWDSKVGQMGTIYVKILDSISARAGSFGPFICLLNASLLNIKLERLHGVA